jgi:hypothetical protein
LVYSGLAVWVGDGLYFIVVAMLLAAAFALHQCEWLILKRRLPPRSRKWYLWPTFNILGMIIGMAISRLTASTMPAGVPNEQPLGSLELAQMCAFGLLYGVVAASLSAYWLHRAVMENTWPYLAMRTIASGIKPLFDLGIPILAIYFITGQSVPSSPLAWWWMSYHLSAQIATLFLHLFLSALSGVLVATGLWMMARSAAHNLELGTR